MLAGVTCRLSRRVSCPSLDLWSSCGGSPASPIWGSFGTTHRVGRIGTYHLASHAAGPLCLHRPSEPRVQSLQSTSHGTLDHSHVRPAQRNNTLVHVSLALLFHSLTEALDQHVRDIWLDCCHNSPPRSVGAKAHVSINPMIQVVCPLPPGRECMDLQIARITVSLLEASEHHSSVKRRLPINTLVWSLVSLGHVLKCEPDIRSRT